jgi:hypothetical protein
MRLKTRKCIMQYREFRTSVVVLLTLMLTVVLPAYAGKFNRVVDIGASMPEFSNLPATDGKTLSSRDLRESVVVFVFLANHCPWANGGRATS